MFCYYLGIEPKDIVHEYRNKIAKSTLEGWQNRGVTSIEDIPHLGRPPSLGIEIE